MYNWCCISLLALRRRLHGAILESRQHLLVQETGHDLPPL